MSQPRSFAQETRAPGATPSVPQVPQALRTALRRALLIPAVVIGALCALLAWQVAALSAHNRWVAHTHEVIAQTWQVKKLLIDHETGLRARLLSGDDTFLQTYTAARAELPEAFGRLRRLAADNPPQQAQIDELRSHHEDWRRNAEEALARSRQSEVSVRPGLIEEMRARKVMMDAMRGTVEEILAEEDRLLAERRRNIRRATRRLVVWGGVSALVLGSAAALVLRRLVRSLDASYARAFRAQSESLRVAEALAAEVTEQLRLAMATISDARERQRRAEARAAELERPPGTP